nr:MAG TPA: hypothetical protein [Caudoviricetes sp.]
MKIQMVHVICVCTQVCLTTLRIPLLPVTVKATLLRAGGLTGAPHYHRHQPSNVHNLVA